MSGTSDIAGLISAIAGLVAAIAALGGLAVATLGLSTWRRELRGREDFSLSKELLRAVLRVRDEIRFVRDPSMFPAEWKDRPDREGSQPISDPKDVEYAYQGRWDRLVQAGSDLEAKLLEAEVLWGSGLAEPNLALKRIVARLNVALRQHLRALTNDRYAETLPPERLRQIDAIIWANYDEPDELTSELEGAIKQFESRVRPYLGRRDRKRSLRDRLCGRP